MPKLDLSKAPVKTGSIYPAPFDAMVEGRSSLRLGKLGGLTQFGVNLVRLAPGALSSLRHWHLHEDEFVMVTSGTCTLVDDDGRHVMEVGECAAFPAGEENGHHLINETEVEATFLVIGTSHPDEVAMYSDVDFRIEMTDYTPAFMRRDRSPLTEEPS